LSLRRLIGERVALYDNPVVLLSVNAMTYQDGVLDTLRYFSERFGTGLYITLNKPCTTLQVSFEKSGVPRDKVVYLDSITNTNEHDNGSCCYLGRMRELTDLCIALTKLISQRKEVRFVLIDSVSTLLIYNDAKSVARFCHAVSEKLRSVGLPAAFVLVEMEEARDMVAQLAQFVDSYIKAEA
jgi:hypothetical protein